MTMRWRPVVEWVGFQVVWLACALGAVQGQNAPGVVAAAMFIGAVLATKGWPLPECRVILASGAVGLVAESALVATELIRFAAPWPSTQLAPAWIVALWLAFGATLSAMASLLGPHLATKASIIGFVAGPLAYWAGERLGALQVSGPVALTYLAIGLIWAVALPSLLVFRQRMLP